MGDGIEMPNRLATLLSVRHHLGCCSQAGMLSLDSTLCRCTLGAVALAGLMGSDAVELNLSRLILL